MGIEEVWMRLAPETRDWLVANNGDAVPADIAAEIDDVIDATGGEDVWAVESEVDTAGEDENEDDDDDFESEDDLEDAGAATGARYLSEESIDWIEEFANDEPE